MAPFCRHPKQTPVSFIVIRHFMTLLSVSTTVLTVYIVKSSRTVTRGYSHLLVMLLIWSTCIDVFIQWIFDPVYLLPLMCIYRRAPILNLPLSSANCVGFILSFIALCGPIYFSLFLYRHQAVTPSKSFFKFPLSAQISFIIVLLIPYGSLGITYCTTTIPVRQHPLFNASIGEDWDPIVLDRVDCFPNGRNYPFLALMAFTPIFGIFFIVTIVWHTFVTLRQVKYISLKMQELHRILTRALVVQALIPVFLVALPMSINSIVIVIFVNNYPETMNSWKIDSEDFVNLIISFHASTHSIALLLTTPAFRIRLYKMFSLIAEEISPVSPTTNASFTAIRDSRNNY